MNRKTFGDMIDIHGGGRDLIFPHHENEIAQTEALTGKRFVKYWIHNGLIKVNGQKMSKSLGNSLLLSDLLDKYSNDAIKYALLSTSYRNDINVTDNLFPDAEKQMGAFYKVIADVEKSCLKATGEQTEVGKLFDEAMNDDFNTALAIAHLFGLFKQAKALLAEKDGRAVDIIGDIRKTYSLLGFFKESAEEYLKKHAVREEAPEEVRALADKMQAARAVKDYATADALRARIAGMGYTVRNTPNGYELDKK